MINFFKKLIGRNRIKESKREPEKVIFNEIETWIEKKRKEIEDKEREIFVLIKDGILEVIKEIKEKVRVLESLDLESKRAEEKIKLIVMENLNNYINYVKDLAENLDNLEEKNLEKFIVRINEILLGFNKKSDRSYEKTTFLIGKEMADTREVIVNFFRYLEKTFNQNKGIIDSSKVIYLAEINLKNVNEINQIIDGLDKEITSLDKKIKNNKEINERVLGEIEKIKKGKNYIENLKKQEEIKLEREELEKEIFKLREKIDFKALGNIFHVSEEKMGIIREYKKDFPSAFQNDNGASILSMLDEAKLNNEAISAKIKQINDKKEEITKGIEAIKKDDTKDLLSKIREIKLEIENFNNEKIKELKKYEKVKIKREELISLIKQELSKINVVIFDA